jgi:hypothetical protein
MKITLLAALIAAFSLVGCASLCDPQDKQCRRNAKEDAADAGAAIGAALDIIGTIEAPTTTTTTTTRTCTKDRRGEEACTTTTNGN